MGDEAEVFLDREEVELEAFVEKKKKKKEWNDEGEEEGGVINEWTDTRSEKVRKGGERGSILYNMF